MYYRLEDNDIGFLGDFKTLEELFERLKTFDKESFYHISIYQLEGDL